MDNLLPDINPNTYTGTAVAAGYVLTEILNINEQLALSNWLELIAEILQTNAAYAALLKIQADKIKEASEKEMAAFDKGTDTLDDEEAEEVVDSSANSSAILKAMAQIQEDIALLKNRI